MAAYGENLMATDTHHAGLLFPPASLPRVAVRHGAAPLLHGIFVETAVRLATRTVGVIWE
jgi:hypothetical protein